MFGWPYCFLDGKTNQMILAPEYGGDGTTVGRCAQFERPIAGLPAHSAPVDLQFFDHPALPAKYLGGVRGDARLVEPRAGADAGLQHPLPAAGER